MCIPILVHMKLICEFRVPNPINTWLRHAAYVSGRLGVFKIRFGVVLKWFGVFPRSGKSLVNPDDPVV